MFIKNYLSFNKKIFEHVLFRLFEFLVGIFLHKTLFSLSEELLPDWRKNVNGGAFPDV